MRPDFIAPTPCTSISDRLAAAACPTLDLRAHPDTPEQLLAFATRFAAFFFERDATDVHADTQIGVDLVGYWATEGGTNAARAESADPFDLAMVSFVLYAALGNAMGLNLFDHDIDPEHLTLGDLAAAIAQVVCTAQASGTSAA